MELQTFTIILAVLLALSEALALIPAIQDNSIFQFVWRVLKFIAGKR